MRLAFCTVNHRMPALSKMSVCFFFQAEDGIRYLTVTGVQTCALPISAIPEPMREALDPVASDAEPMDRDGRLVAWRLMRSAMLDLFGPVGVTIGALVLSATAFNLAIQRLDLPPFLASKQEKQVPPSQKQPRRQDEQIPSNQQTQEPIPQTDKVRKDSGSPGKPSPQPRGLQRRSSRLNLPCLVEHRLATLHLAQDVIA